MFEIAEANRLCQRLLNSSHPKQRDAVEDPSNFVSILCPRGAGKTAAVIFRMLRKMITIPNARCVFIATTREMARTLIWDDLKNIVENLGIGPETNESSFAEVRLTLQLRSNGSMLRLVGADDEREIDKLRGKSYHEVAIDEAASHRAELLERLIERVIGPRLGDTNGCIVLLGTPGHHLEGMFYDVTRPSGTMHRPYAERETAPEALWSSHAWNLLDGAAQVPALARLWQRALEDKAKAGWSDEHPVWRRERLGLWAADDTENIYKFRPYLEDGTAWNIWDPERVGPMRIGKLPPRDGKPVTDWLYAFGADMGSADPFALQVFACSPTDQTKTLYHVFEFESPSNAKMYAKRIAELLFGDDDGSKPWPNHGKPLGVIGAVGWPSGSLADMAHLGEAILEELANVYGFRFDALPRAPGNKASSIELANGDLVDGRIKVLKGSKLAAQLGSLQWERDEYGKVKEKKSQANHAADAFLGARMKLAGLFANDVTPVVPESVLGKRRPRTPDYEYKPASTSPDAFNGGDAFVDAWDAG